jgi:hypothetical protein
LRHRANGNELRDHGHPKMLATFGEDR